MTDAAAQTRRNAFVHLTALCTVVYFVSYISRINLSAERGDSQLSHSSMPSSVDVTSMPNISE